MVALSLNDADLAFAHLFEGSKKAFGTENGGSAPTTNEDWPKLWHHHLHGERPIGVYPMVENVTFSSPEGAEEPDQIVFDWGVRWGCIDLDVKREGKRRYDYETEEEAHVAAINLCAVLTQLGIDGWIEVTRSRGRHVWVFSKAFVRARTMRRALLVACEVAGVPPTEVNPKSEALAPGQLGNYVRMVYPNGASEWVESRELGVAGRSIGGGGVVLSPLQDEQEDGGNAASPSRLASDDGQGHSGTRCAHCGRWWVGLHREAERQGNGQDGLRGKGYVALAGTRRGTSGSTHVGGVPLARSATAGTGHRVPTRVVLDPEAQAQALCLGCFVAEATDSASPSFVFHDAAKLYKAPAQKHYTSTLVPADDLPDEVRQKMSGLLWTVYTDGPTEGLDLDRSGWLYRLASMCAKDRLTPDEAALVVALADEQHCQKYSGRADGEKQIMRTVERAYAASDYEEEE